MSRTVLVASLTVLSEELARRGARFSANLVRDAIKELQPPELDPPNREIADMLQLFADEASVEAKVNPGAAVRFATYRLWLLTAAARLR